MRNWQNGKIPAAELKEKSKERLRVFALYLILAMVIVLLIWMNGETAAINIGFDNENVYTLRDGWTMERSQEKSLVTLPMDSTASKKETVSYTKTLEAQDSYCNMIMFHSSHQRIKIYLDGELLYTFGYGQSMPVHFSVGSAWQFTRLPADWEGKELRIETKGVYDSYSGKQELVYMGTKTSLVFMVAKQKMVSLLVDLFLFIMGVLLIMSSFFFREARTVSRIRYLGIFAIVTCTWILLKSGVGQIFSGNILMSMNVLYLLFGLMPVLTISFLLTFDSFSKSTYMKGLYWFSIACYFVMQFLQLANVMDYTQTVSMNHINFLLIVIGIAGICIRKKIRGEKIEDISVFVACFAFAGLGAVDIYRFYFEKTVQSHVGFTQAGLICFICSLGYSVVKQSSEEQTRMIENEALKKIAYLDILTNLPNRTAFEKQMEQYRTEYSEKKPVVMIVDLNGLKEINDTYGHKAGDAAIIRTAQLLDRHFGQPLHTYRIGGDEFCVLGEGETEEIFGQRIRGFLDAVEKADREYAFSFSAAYGYVKSGEEGIDKAFINADRKMYNCKMQMKQLQAAEKTRETSGGTYGG